MSQLLSSAGSLVSEPALELMTLGRFQIRRRGQPLPDDAWPTQKSKQLVKLLLTRRGELTPADQIMEWLWPDLPPDRARNNLWVAVSQARRVLEPALPPRAPSAYIASEGDGYRFLADSDHRWDVAEFRRAWAAARAQTDPAARTTALEAARALYTGDYLAEDPYEAWAIPLREALRAAYIELLLALGESYAQAGQYTEAIAQAQAVLALEAASEPAYQALMRYHYFAGDQRAARLAYDACVRALREELDAPPMPATVELYRQIQRHTLPLPTGATPIVAPGATAEEAAYSLTHTPFVGRAREYNILVCAVQAAADGQGRIILIEGEPGIGKSRLVQEAIAYARGQGMTTLLAHCYQVEQAIPYQPIVDMLDQALAETPARLFLDLPPVYLAELAALAPELGTLLDERPAPPDEGGVRQLRRFRALQQCLELLAGERGLLLAMDDIHWADYPTRQFLHHLATHIARLPILLICTYRSEEAAADPELATFIDSVSRAPQTTRLALDRLTPGDTGALLDLLTGSSEAARHLGEWLHAETDGNPFFVISILQSLVEQELLHEARPAWQVDAQRIDICDASLALPDALRESVRVRLRRLPTPMRRVLEVAAVLGRRFDFATLAAASGEREDSLLELVEGLLQRQLLRETGAAEAGPYGLGHDYDFSHDKIREVVYHDISNARRVLLHRSV
ncbi:MAG TPA: AAA family ATPase, partial [Caldilineaceae bacterium]|nr:AAA family ATPase [Caldilineaceae bacterium]